MSGKIILLTASLLAVLSLTSTAHSKSIDAFDDMKGTLNIAGGTAHIPVMKAAAQAIMTKHPDVTITIAGGGSGLGVVQAGDGLVDIGNTGRPLKQSEIDKYKLQSFSFAIDGVAVVINPKNNVKNITTQQLADIFSGTIKNWKELGGKDAPISIYTREDGSGTRECFVDNGLKAGINSSDDAINKIRGTILTSANVVNSNGAMKTAVGQDSNAIGYVSIGYLDKSTKALSLDGVAATQKNAQSLKYPVVRQLYMNTKGEPQGLTKAFVDFILAKENSAFITDSGYIPLK